jgi:hypothetical protein
MMVRGGRFWFKLELFTKFMEEKSAMNKKDNYA